MSYASPEKQRQYSQRHYARHPDMQRRHVDQNRARRHADPLRYEKAARGYMIGRCYCETNPLYGRYGGRGITVCPRWRESFESFFADMGARPAGLTLDRIDNDGNYEPGNCRWATRTEQNRNRSCNHRISFRGETLPLSVWAERVGLNHQTLRTRLRHGWPIEKALTAPLDNTRKKTPALSAAAKSAGVRIVEVPA